MSVKTIRLALVAGVLVALCSQPGARTRPAAYPPLIGGGQHGSRHGPADLVLIYQGGVHRLSWTEEQLQGYVTYRDRRSGREQWLFDGFLFFEFQDGRGTRYVGQFKLRSAIRADWMWLSDRLFSRGVALDALEQAIAAASSRLGSPPRRRKVYLGLPEPILRQKDWGQLDGRWLDFNVPEDRLAAIRWYVRETLRRWRERAFTQFDLQGFYWVAEDASQSRLLLPEVAELIHREKLELIWIPYWVSPWRTRWRALGFDRAYLQPNHFFRPAVPDSRLDEACATARALGMGLEIEFDGRAWTDDAYRARLPAYFARFRAAGALAAAPLAWYEAGGAIARMASSDDPSVRGLYDKVARVVIARQAAADKIGRPEGRRNRAPH